MLFSEVHSIHCDFIIHLPKIESIQLLSYTAVYAVFPVFKLVFREGPPNVRSLANMRQKTMRISPPILRMIKLFGNVIVVSTQ